MAKWEPDQEGIKAAMKAWCNFAGTGIDPCEHCVEADFVTMLYAYLVATKQIESECESEWRSVIVHNVRDRRVGWIGSWEAEPLEYDKLGPEHIGRTVIYRDHRRAEAGTITSWRGGTVFARYGRGDTAAGAHCSDLVLAVRRVDDPEGHDT